MKERPNLNELAKEIHNDNKLKGFHDVNWSDEHCLMLAICELCEAIEADRKGKKEISKEDIDKMEYITTFHPNNTKLFIYAYQNRIKGSIEEELADSVIRLLDLAGKRNVYIMLTNGEFYFNKNMNQKTLTEQLYQVVYDLMTISNHLSETISIIIAQVEYVCKLKDIDLYTHIDLKLKYNKTRPYKHGKEY